jgi:hypothetical protein
MEEMYHILKWGLVFGRVYTKLDRRKKILWTLR